jgi:hypothetical protein
LLLLLLLLGDVAVRSMRGAFYKSVMAHRSCMGCRSCWRFGLGVSMIDGRESLLLTMAGIFAADLSWLQAC